MGKVVDMNKIIRLSNIFTIISYILIHISDLPYTRVIRDMLLFINLLILIIYFFIIRKKIYITQSVKVIIPGLLLLFFLYPITCLNSIYSKEIIIYSLESLLFILNVFFISMYIYLHNLKYEYIKTTYIILSTILIVQYILNFDSFEVLRNIHLIFSNSERYRQSFGFNHPNTTAQLCFITLILYRYFKDNCKYDKFYNKIAINLIIWIILLSTSSRTAITSIIIFYAIFTLKIHLEKYDLLKNPLIKKSIKIICFMLMGLILYSIYINVTSEELEYILLESNRLLNFTINIPIIYSYNKEIFGLGYLSPGMVLSEDFYYKMINIDNWFLYIFISLGIIGLVLSLIMLIYLYRGIYKNNRVDKKYRSLNIALFITFLYYSIFESIFLLTDLATSFIVWILLILALYGERVKQNYIKEIS